MVKHFRMQPLPTSFMLGSIIGFLFSTLYVWSVNMTWGFTFSFFFAILFIASVYNFTHAEGEEHLDMHDTDFYKRESKARNTR